MVKPSTVISPILLITFSQFEPHNILEQRAPRTLQRSHDKSLKVHRQEQLGTRDTSCHSAVWQNITPVPDCAWDMPIWAHFTPAMGTQGMLGLHSTLPNDVRTYSDTGASMRRLVRPKNPSSPFKMHLVLVTVCGSIAVL